jgi:hypothetical protein
MQLFQNKKQNQNEWYLSNQKENKKYTENIFWNKPNRSLIFIFYLCFMLEGGNFGKAIIVATCNYVTKKS